MAILTAGPHRIYYETAGQGRMPLLLCNGLAMSTFAWSFVLPYLAPYYRLVLLDFLGQGQSDKPALECYDLYSQADLAAAVLDELGIARAHVVGLSYGGMVAQHFAHRHGERVDHLVLAATLAWSDTVNCHIIDSWIAAHTAGGFDLRFLVSLPWLFSSRGLEGQAGFLSELKKIGALVDWPALLRLMAGVRKHDSRPWLGALGSPAIVLVGEEDRLTPLYQAAVLAGGIPNAELIELPQTGHALHVEAPEAFAREILRFCPYQ
jgi:3-oxoadipate enol-lactonase